MNRVNKIETLEEKKRANKFCILSILLFIGPIVLNYIFAFIVYMCEQKMGIDIHYNTYYNFDTLDNLSRVFTISYTILKAVGILSMISSFIIMIMVRVLYPLNVFGKVIMWIYISMFIVFLVLFIILMIACNMMVDSCVSCGSEILEVWRNCD